MLWYGVWGNPRILDASGNVLLYTLGDGFCTSYEIYDEDCNVNLFGKNDRYQPQIGSTTFDKGLSFGGNAAWHVYIPDSVKSNMRIFKATVGASRAYSVLPAHVQAVSDALSSCSHQGSA
jgi:hypothetical protein